MNKLWNKIINRDRRRFTFRRRMIVIMLGVVIGVSSVVFTNNMARQLRKKEQNEVLLWSYAFSKLTGEIATDDPLIPYIVNTRNNIPFVIVDDRMGIYQSHLIPQKVLSNPELLRKKIQQMGTTNKVIEIPTWANDMYYIYFGESVLLKSLVFYPYIQLAIILVFLLFTYITFRSTEQDEKNRVWIGLAKETAHQLGTPISSLMGWVQYLRTQQVDQQIVEEMDKDLIRLTKVVDRFSKIGSETELSAAAVNEIVGDSVLYFRSRVPKNVTLSYNGLAMGKEIAMVNEALFEWVIENLLKNALDALSGVGAIDVKLHEDGTWIYIDVKDSGKGIPKSNFKAIFKPGFTTKTRGWGLGLSLSKRIIEDYHKGKIFVLESEVDKGTTMRVALKKVYS